MQYRDQSNPRITDGKSAQALSFVARVRRFFVLSALRLGSLPYYWSLRRIQDSPENHLKSLLRRLGENGRTPQTLEDFRASPITTWADDYRERVTAPLETATHSPLNGERILYWVTSGGTSSDQKKISYTASHVRSFRFFGAAMMLSLARTIPNLGMKGFLFLFNGKSRAPTDAGVPIGYFPYVENRKMPKLFHTLGLFVVPPSVAELGSDRYFEELSFHALFSEVEVLSTVAPQRIRFLFQRILENRERLFALAEERKNKLSRKRVEFLRNLDWENVNCFLDLWPTLKVVIVWKKAICSAEVADLEKTLLKGVRITETLYGSTEGVIAIPFPDLREDGVLLNLRNQWIEFVPISEIDRATELRKDLREITPSILSFTDVKVGEEYEILVTNSLGFRRYRMYDRVRILGFSPWGIPFIEFIGKSDRSLGLGFIRLKAEVVEQAIRSVLGSGNHLFFPSENGDQLIGLLPEEEILNGTLESVQYLLEVAIREAFPAYTSFQNEGMVKPLLLERIRGLAEIIDAGTHLQAKRYPTVPRPPRFYVTP